MKHILPLAFATTGALLARERNTRQNAERLAAALLETLLNAIDANDAQTGSHVRRVARFALILADAADLEAHECHAVERVALFHDIGKISEALFDIIHEGRQRLTPEERRAIASHPQRGAEVLKPLTAFYPDLAEGVLSHHERWDGTGYPRRLKGEAIPLSARIVAIADSFDAITHSRPYKSGHSAETGAELICKGRGTQFDPDLTDLFLAPPVFDEIKRAMAEAYAAERRGDNAVQPRTEPNADRRQQRQPEPKPVPDVKFRWRESALEQPR
jgi:HD-GYP domain-containing protein (c-di-GMP phosphodiesterase class II)